MHPKKPKENEKRLQSQRDEWNRAAPTFDEEADHGLRDPLVRAAWTERFHSWLPSGPLAIVDIGCGTGSLSVILAEQGHAVQGIDLSPAMIALAREKAAALGLTISFEVMDAAFPRLTPGQFDVILCRHLLWALPEPAQVLVRWAGLLKPEGQFILIEGHWHTGVGLSAQEISALLPPEFTCVQVENLALDPTLWGQAVTDERYAIIAVRAAQA